MAVRLIVCSSSDIVKEEAEKMGMIYIPMEVRINDEEYLDGDTLSHKEFFEKLATCDELPKTSQINEYRFGEVFEEVVNNGDEAVCITLSSKFSGTYNNAVEASKKFEGKIFVIDSMTASAGEKILCEQAKRLIDKGLSAKETAEKLEKSKTKIRFLALLDTLKYLRKGGRISAVVAIAGELLSIKPLIAHINGEVKLIGKAIGSKKGNNLLCEHILKNDIDFDMPYTAVYSGTDETIMTNYLKEYSKIWEGKAKDMPYYMLGSTVGTHIGPKAIGFAFFEK